MGSQSRTRLKRPSNSSSTVCRASGSFGSSQRTAEAQQMPGGLSFREADLLAQSHTAGQQQSQGQRTRGARSGVPIPGLGQHGLWVGLQLQRLPGRELPAQLCYCELSVWA